MKVTINKNNFGDIETAVFYRFNKYIPDTIPSGQEDTIIKDFISDRIKYKAGKSVLDDGDFIEYGLSYLIEKKKFNDTFKLNLLDNFSKELIGKNVDDLEKLENSLLVTGSYSNEDELSIYSYFNSGLISNQTFLSFLVPGADSNGNGYWKIELYEETLSSNNDIVEGFVDYDYLTKFGINTEISPVLTITLGPEPNIKNNLSKKYYPFDPKLVNKVSGVLLELGEFKNLEEEINHSKFIGMLFSSDNKKVDINLSYKAWSDSNNPNRNMNKYLLRNDYFFSSRDSIKVVDKLENTEFWYDLNSGTLVGNKETDLKNCPLLKNKLGKIGSEFSPFRTYNKGELVEYNKDTWKSLKDGNLGENPMISSNWILLDSDNIKIPRILVSIYPKNSGYSTPSGYLTISDNTKEKEFNLIENNGYKIKKSNICSYEIGSPLPETDYSFKTTTDKEGNIINTVTIKNWEKILESNKLIFNFEISKSIIQFFASDGNIQIPYSEWKNYFNESNLKIHTITVDNTNIDLTNFNGTVEIDPEKEFIVTIPELESHVITSVTSRYTNLGNIEEKTITPNLDNGFYSFKDRSDYTESIYNINLDYRYIDVLVLEAMDFELSDTNKRVRYGDSYTTMFYPRESKLFREVYIEDDLGNSIVIINSDLGTLFKLGKASVYLSRNSDIYTLSITNTSANYKIYLRS